MSSFFKSVKNESSPMKPLLDLLINERKKEIMKEYDKQRFVGYVISLDFWEAKVITSDPFKLAVGGVPRQSFLIMVPEMGTHHDATQVNEIEDRVYESFGGYPPFFILLRVLQSSDTPLSRDVQQTYFELQKRSMPELDVFTQSELQWGGLKTEVLGMFYESGNEVRFSADLNNLIAPHKYRVYSPNADILYLIVNSFVKKDGKRIGWLRLTENELVPKANLREKVPVLISLDDFKGTRTALFGKTRLGKSNTIKILVMALMKSKLDIGHLIFDVNGEYANANPQNPSLPEIFPEKCVVYAITQKEGTLSIPLKLNFYAFPSLSHQILGELLKNDRKDTSNYVRSFISADVPSLEEYDKAERGERVRLKRKLLMYWIILKNAGFEISDEELKTYLGSSLNPGFNKNLRKSIHDVSDNNDLPSISSLNDVMYEFERLFELYRSSPQNSVLRSTGSGNPILDEDDIALLTFFKPRTGSGTRLLQPYRVYHSPFAGDFVTDIITALDQRKTVIIDLSNAHPLLMDYYSEFLSRELFREQTDRFANNKLGDHYIQIYFEEAHNLFPNTDTSEVDIYRRLAKEGAKYNIGMVYSTQSPSSIHPDLLAQTENFFVAHLSSPREVEGLAKMNIEFQSCKDDLLKLREKGFVRMLTRSHRYVIPVQIERFGKNAL